MYCRLAVAQNGFDAVLEILVARTLSVPVCARVYCPSL